MDDAGETRQQPEGDRPHTKVAVCALAYKRPVGLARLLDGLAALEPADDTTLEVIIVDNDPEASAREVVEARMDDFPVTLRYVHEEQVGIPFGRNRAVATALEHGADHVAFLDDDEVPEPNWIAELVAVGRRTGADVVTGPVEPVFDEPPPDWVVEGGFFERPRFRTGESIGYARTSNVLIARHVFPDRRPFEEAMRNTGSDDTHFFMRAKMQGHTIVWADDAWVREAVPTSRVAVGWLLRREYRRGITLSTCLRLLDDRPVRRVRRLAHGVLRVVQGLAETVVGLVRGRAARVKGLKRVCFGAGLVAGLFGFEYDEYRTHHGR